MGEINTIRNNKLPLFNMKTNNIKKLIEVSIPTIALGIGLSYIPENKLTMYDLHKELFEQCEVVYSSSGERITQLDGQLLDNHVNKKKIKHKIPEELSLECSDLSILNNYKVLGHYSMRNNKEKPTSYTIYFENIGPVIFETDRYSNINKIIIDNLEVTPTPTHKELFDIAMVNYWGY